MTDDGYRQLTWAASPPLARGYTSHRMHYKPQGQVENCQSVGDLWPIWSLVSVDMVGYNVVMIREHHQVKISEAISTLGQLF